MKNRNYLLGDGLLRKRFYIKRCVAGDVLLRRRFVDEMFCARKINYLEQHRKQLHFSYI
jgi:hypothetical protein